MLLAGRVDRPVVSLTFDDGYADNFVSLRAVAEEMEIPVAIFVTTQPVNLHCEFQHDLVRGIRGAFAMTWGQIRYWQGRGAEFGSHTRTHIKCGLVDDEVLDDEIAGSKAEFEAQLNKAPTFFAFPYGDRQNMPLVAVRIAMSAYPYVLSSFGGENLPNSNRENAHLYRKKAYADPWELELELQSVFDLVARVKRLFVKAEAPEAASITGPACSPETPKARQNVVIDQSANQFGSHRPSSS